MDGWIHVKLDETTMFKLHIKLTAPRWQSDTLHHSGDMKCEAVMHLF